MKLEGRKIAVTGGTGGIGSEVVLQLARAGAQPLVLGRVRNDGLPGHFIECDLATTQGAVRAGRELAGHAPHALINLAGVQYFGQFEQQSPEALAQLYAINLVAPALLAQAVLPGMKKRGSGHIVNVGSIFGSISFAHFVAYSSAKAGMKALSEGLRRELEGSGVQVTYVAPRAVKTPMNNSKVMQLARATRMAMDNPADIAARILRAVEGGEKDVYIGFPESLFVRVNALLPRVVDSALRKNNRIAASILIGE